MSRRRSARHSRTISHKTKVIRPCLLAKADELDVVCSSLHERHMAVLSQLRSVCKLPYQFLASLYWFVLRAR